MICWTHLMYSSQICLKFSLSGSHLKSSYNLFRRTEAVSCVLSVRGRQLDISGIWPATFKIFFRPGKMKGWWRSRGRQKGHRISLSYNAKRQSARFVAWNKLGADWNLGSTWIQNWSSHFSSKDTSARQHNFFFMDKSFLRKVLWNMDFLFFFKWVVKLFRQPSNSVWMENL